jgi:hypothetical protein
MRILKIGLTVAALGFGGAAFAQTPATPNANLPGGGATVPPASAGGMSGVGSSNPTPTPLGQGNLPPTSTNNLGAGGNNVTTTPGMGSSTTGDFSSSTSNVPSTTLNAPSTTLNPPSSATGTNSSTFGTPGVGTRGGLPSTQTPQNLGVPLSNPVSTPATGTSSPGNIGPGSVGGLPTSTP